MRHGAIGIPNFQSLQAWASGCARFKSRSVVILLALVAWASVATRASAQPPDTPPAHVLVVGTKEAPPFAMKGANGEWSGVSIDLWRRVAADLGLQYRFAEASDSDTLLAETKNGTVDLAVAAITVTAERARSVDFTQPFFSTGLGIAVSTGGQSPWTAIKQAFVSFGFLQAIAILIGAAICVGTLVWALERRQNDYYGGLAKGWGSGVWWSAVAMTQAGAAQNAPKTLPGRVLAVGWMIASIVTMAVFTAGVTSALTKRALQGAVQSAADLRDARVGAVVHSPGSTYLDRTRITHGAFETPDAGLKALQAGQIDAFVHDKPLLAWLVEQDFPGRLRMIDTSFDEQNYAIALPKGSPLQASLNQALLDETESDWWRLTTFQYLGRN